MLEKVRKNKYGYELKEKPTAEMQRKNFEETYFQECQNGYEPAYTEEEIRFFTNKAAQKEMALQRIWERDSEKKSEKRKALDIGCGEGFLLKYLYQKGYDVTGIDFTDYAISKYAPELLGHFMRGDCYDKLQMLAGAGRKFDLINMDSVLDMVQRPGELLELMKQVLAKGGLVACKVGNNYSILQMKLLEEGVLAKDYWLDEEGHPWYFHAQGLEDFFKDHGYLCMDVYAEGLSEFFLLHTRTNYYEHPEAGKECYLAKVRLENLLHERSPERAQEIMRQLGRMGLGRETVGIFRLGTDGKR
ncbi:MAG: class I SAM-dependent methyltransferase [Eubacterium sp.]|nr:class I SAM-dependent methyltransferase [Eubacterium sp.]